MHNSVRCVDVTAESGLRFWIGNIELNFPYDKITNLHRLDGTCRVCSPGLLPYWGLLRHPTDGVAVFTKFWALPWSAGRPERRLGPLRCLRPKIVFRPANEGLNFIQEVEKKMHGAGREEGLGLGGNRMGKGKVQPPSFGGG